jgi:hypothetical protein
MKTWFNYAPLTGSGPQLSDDGSHVLCAASITREGQEPIEVAIIGDTTKLELVRVGTPGDGDLSDAERHEVASITNHAIAVLQLLYDSKIGKLPLAGQHLSIGQHSKDDGTPELSVNVRVFGHPPKFDGAQIKAAIEKSSSIRLQMSLLAEAVNPAVPLAYRYLCFYKILELELRKTGYWTGLDEHLIKYETKFADLKISKAKLKNFLHNYRDRCAHIKTGRHDEFGVTGLASRESEIVEKFMPLLHTIVADLWNQRYSDRIKVGPPPPELKSLGNLDGTELPPEIVGSNR